MRAPKPAPPDFLADTLAHIEAHLFSALSVAALADAVGLSPWHFSRAFTARLGESVMGYVRSRRLEAAAFRLAAANPPSLIDLAFDCGFESQEAFTRAFRRRFGVPPGKFQRTTTKHDRRQTAMTDTTTAPRVTMRDQLVHRDGFTVAGPRAIFDGENKSGIPLMWPRLLKCLPLAGQVDGRAYGVMSMLDGIEGSISYLAGVEVTGDGALPAGFERITIPANDYAVFRLELDGPNLHPQIQAAMPIIWGEMVPRAGFKIAQAPDFELCPEGFDPAQKGAWLEMWLPVEG
ncbi:MAG TPA: helix-turn-helix domain-containing protein [Rhizomicrobium sp.]|jgi:AraC family transcriptional regulator|nr:helix-turn-helix domain-containing protein [Rhizomicrobium sp.]